MMKIIQINSTYGSSDSTGRSTMELHKGLLENGIKSSCYVTQINDNSTDSNVYKFSSEFGMKIHGFMSRLLGRQGHFSRISTLNLIKSIKAERPDIVMLGVLHSNCVNLPMLLRYLANNKIPVVLVLHDCWYYTGHCCYYSQIACNKWMNQCGECPEIRNWNTSWIFDFSKYSLIEKKLWYSKMEFLAVVGVSDWIVGEAKKSILKDANVIRRIYNWIDLDVFKPMEPTSIRNKLGISDKTRVLLGVASNWTQKKGLNEMIAVSKQITNVKVIMVGKMPTKVEIPESMVCIGTVKDIDELAQYYSLANCFLNPSVQETFGKTTAEAISCGTPAIVYNTTACPELIGDGCGEVVPLGDANEFISRTEMVLDNLNKYSNCRSWALSNFEKTNNIKEYIQLFEEMLSTKKN